MYCTDNKLLVFSTCELKKWVVFFLQIIILLFVTRQVPLNNYSIISNISLLILFMLSWRNKKGLIFNSMYVLFLMGISLIFDNSIGLIFRNGLIIWFLLMAYTIEVNIRFIKALYIFCLIQGLFIITLEIILFSFFTPESYLPIRNYSIEQGWGDIYYQWNYYKIPIKGNALLPFVFFVSFLYKPWSKNLLRAFQFIILLAIIIAGNFAYFISVSLFVFYLFFKRAANKKVAYFRILAFITLALTLTPTLIVIISNVLEEKSGDSLGTRWDQFFVLMNNLNESFVTLVLGQGVGNTLSIITSFRDYTDNIYFELQSLYFLNQLGILNLLIYIGVSLVFMNMYIRYKELYIIYILYIIYAFTNPYMFDTNQVIVIMTLVALSNLYNKYNNVQEKNIGDSCLI